jgi:hypothetical protein
MRSHPATINSQKCFTSLADGMKQSRLLLMEFRYHKQSVHESLSLEILLINAGSLQHNSGKCKVNNF